MKNEPQSSKIFSLFCDDCYGNLRVLQTSGFQSNAEIMAFLGRMFFGKENEQKGMFCARL